MLSEVLDLVNKGRAALNREPLSKLPSGRPADACHCVVAAAFDDAVVDGERVFINYPEQDQNQDLAKAWGTSVSAGGRYVILPAVIQSFIDAFDYGDYPELLDFTPNRSEFQFRKTDGGHWYWFIPDTMYGHNFPSYEEAEADLDRFLSRLPR